MMANSFKRPLCNTLGKYEDKQEKHIYNGTMGQCNLDGLHNYAATSHPIQRWVVQPLGSRKKKKMFIRGWQPQTEKKLEKLKKEYLCIFNLIYNKFQEV